MNIISQIHESISHDHKESCSLPELISQVIEIYDRLKTDDALRAMFGNESTAVSE